MKHEAGGRKGLSLRVKRGNPVNALDSEPKAKNDSGTGPSQ